MTKAIAKPVEPTIVVTTREPGSIVSALRSRYFREFIGREVMQARKMHCMRHEVIFSEPEPGQVRCMVRSWVI